MTIPDLEPAAFITERLDGTKRSVMLIEKYDPRKPEFWANEEARAQHRVIPLYAARSAPEAGKAVVKPLEWESERTLHIADWLAGTYIISTRIDGSAILKKSIYGKDPERTECASFQAAKAAAQADFEQRILSALASVVPSGAEPTQAVPAEDVADTRLRVGDYPIGTKAYSSIGGYWTRVATGWQAMGGDVFPRYGGDAIEIELPAAVSEREGQE
jgi:hypothetical protein